MYLVVINPIGSVTSLDLSQLAIWRLETREIQWPGSTTKGLALGVSYVNAGTTGFAAIIAINCLVESEAVVPIAKLGLPGVDRGPMKERLREAVRSLVNADVATKEVDEIAIAASAMVDTYHMILQSLWGFNPPLAAVGTETKGELQGWRWALLREKRFGPWLADGAGMSMAPSAAAFAPPALPASPSAGLPAAPAPATSTAPAPIDPLAPPSLDIGPPPTTENKPRAARKPR